MASKIQVAKFPLSLNQQLRRVHTLDYDEFSDYNNRAASALLDPPSPKAWSMEGDDLTVADQLRDDSFKKRIEVLEQLIISVKRNGGRLPYADGDAIFRSLGLALTDTNWEIRNKCIQLLQEIIPNLGVEVDVCISLVLSKLIANIGDTKVTVRRMVVQALHAYMKHTHNLSVLFDAMVSMGLENDNPAIRREMITALPMLLTPEFVTQDLSNIISSLAKKLLDTSVEDNLKDCSLSALHKIESMVGDGIFSVYLKNLPYPIQRYYLQLSNRYDGYHSLDNDFTVSQGTVNGRTDYRKGYVEESFEFGFVPSHILMRLNDQKDFRMRAQAVEDLKSFIVNTSKHEVSSFLSEMESLINFLSNLLDDSNFKIINVTLEIILNLIDKLERNIKLFLKPIMFALLKRMGDNKIVIRQLVMSIMMKIMHCMSPMEVISIIKDNLQHKNSRVRQETINFIIAALLTFPSKDFDMPVICRSVGPTLTDVKRAVRQAALECFATLAQVMGPGQLQPLVSAVDEVELCSDGEGLMAAVQARLARKQLPRLTSDGLVEYATPLPSSATIRSSSSQPSADTEWIMAVGSGVSNTARSARADTIESGVPSMSARSTPAGGLEMQTLVSAPRPFMSAGRGRNKLPWDESREDKSGTYNTLPSSMYNYSFKVEEGPPKPRHTWTGDDESYQAPTSEPRQQQQQQQPAPQQLLVQHSKRKVAVPATSLSPDELDISASYSQHPHPLQRRSQAALARGIKPEGTKENGLNHEQKTSRAFLEASSDENEAPLPGKPSLARGTVSRRKVPPIPLPSDSIDDSDSGSFGPQDDGQSMNGSLKTIRSSATKKRADKLFEKLERQTSQQSPVLSLTRKSMQHSPVLSQSNRDHLEEVGHDIGSFQNDLSRKSVVKKSERKDPKPYETNNNSSPGKRTMAIPDTTISRSQIIQLDFNPAGSGPFRDNHGSEVQVVGKGYNEDSSDTALKLTSSLAASRLKERKRLNTTNNRAGTLLSHTTLGSTHLPGSTDTDSDEKAENNSGMSLVGKGMLETSPTTDHMPALGQPVEKRPKPKKPELTMAPAGVVGVAVKSVADLTSLEMSSGEEDWEDDNLALTQSLKEKLAVRQQLRLEEDERRRLEKENMEREKEEKREREREEKLKKERERQQEKLKRLSSAESIHALEALSVSGSGTVSTTPIHSLNTPTVRSVPHSPKLTPAAVTPRRTIKQTNDSVLSFPMSVESMPSDLENPEEWKPFKDSEGALRDTFKKMEHDDWETKCEGIHMLRRLCKHHSDTVLASLHQIVLAITSEVQNLRSQVSRLAMKAVGDMFVGLKKYMDPEVELTTKVLLAKGAESNQFIREDVDKALYSMIENVTPQRAVLGLIAGGAQHKNAQIRKMTAQLLSDLVDKMGSGRVLSGVKDITDRILPAAAQFAMDGSQETRYFGRKILYSLIAHQDFDKMLSKYLPANTLRSIQDIVDSLRQKGLGEHPSEVSSARSRRSGNGSRSSSAVREGSANSSADGGGVSLASKRRVLIRTNDAQMEEVKALVDQLAANNWQQRYDGVSNFQSMCESNPTLVSTHIIKIFDKFLPRLQDSNSKVNLYALKVMYQVTPILKDHMGSVVSMTVAAVAPNLSSKNREIYSTAAEVLEAFIENIDLSLLVQPFASQAINASSRSKADLVVKVAYLVEKVYPRKQKQVVLHVLPLLWHLLGSMNTSGAAVQGVSGDLRQATSMLVNKLHECMGPGLLEKASAEPSNTQRQIQMLQDMLEDS